MHKIVLADIFGLTDALVDFCEELQGDIDILTPYSQPIKFASEADAYKHFTRVTSVDEYAQKLLDKISGDRELISLLGFSVGGSAIWHLCENLSLKNSTTALSYYAGQIRHQTTLEPCFPITLIMPKKEPHFSVEELSHSLAQKPLLDIQQNHYLHGFMNPLSTNFNQSAYQANLDVLRQLAPDQPFISAQP